MPSPPLRPPLVHVLVLNWNGAPDTLACLASLDRLDYPNAAVVVIDNGSGDDSVARIRRERPHQELIENGANLGFGAGNNRGIRRALAAGADYVWVLNNDAVVEPATLSAMVAAAEADSRLGAVGSALYHLDRPERMQAWGGGWVDLWSGRAGHFVTPVADAALAYLTGASLLLRAAALRQVGDFDEEFFMYWEDADLGLRLRRAGWGLAVAAEGRVRHAESGSLGKGNPTLDRYYNRSAVRFFRKHAPLPAVPIAVGGLGRLAKRLLHGEWRRLWAVGQGTVQGLASALRR